VAFCVINVPIIERIASRMRREMVSLRDRKRSKMMERNPLSFMLTVGSDFFIWSFNQFEKKKYLLPYLCRQAYLPKAGD
jgi:hypothetical protein